VKNPLAGIRGVIQVLGKRLPPNDASGPVLKEIIARIDALDRMMKDLLMFARTPKPRREPVDLAPLVSSTADLLRQDPALSELAIEIQEAPVVVVGDAEMLKLVFHNLLLNSAQAMQGSGRIQVALQANASVGEITFTDNGPGIPEDVRQKIFTPFFTTKSRGSGLGLPTAKRLIEAQHGSIAIDCPSSGGTTVAVRLPLNVH
jgi:two-component system sensor histidine kinase PilS (NtrC family)